MLTKGERDKHTRAQTSLLVNNLNRVKHPKKDHHMCSGEASSMIQIFIEGTCCMCVREGNVDH